MRGICLLCEWPDCLIHLQGFIPGFAQVLGHEFVGRVISRGPGLSLTPSVGAIVVGEINIACERCENCRAGGLLRRNHCSERVTLGILDKDGAMAEYITLPASNCHVVPSAVTLGAATFVEPLAAAYRVIEQYSPTKEENVAVIGDGKLGLLIAEVLRTRPHKTLYVFGHHADRMSLLPEDIKTVLVKDDEDIEPFEDKFALVVEATGHAEGILKAATLVKPLGTLIVKTACASSKHEVDTTPFILKEVTTIGSRCGNFKMAIDALADKVIDVEKYISKEIAFSDAESALEEASLPHNLKVHLVMNDEKSDKTDSQETKAPPSWTIVQREPGPWFNIKMSSYQYRKSHCGDKTIVRSSYLHNGISYTGKMTSLYWSAPRI